MTHALAVESAKVSGAGARLSLNELQAMALAATDRGLGSHHVATDPALKLAFSAAIVDLFWVGLGVAVLGLLAILMIPDMTLRSHHHPEPVAEPGEEFLNKDPQDDAPAKA